MSPSNDASSNGSRSASPWTSSIRSPRPAASTRLRPSTSISPLWSSPTTRHPVRRAARSRPPRSRSPRPAPSSGPTSIRETRKRRQRGSCPRRRGGSRTGRTSAPAGRRGRGPAPSRGLFSPRDSCGGSRGICGGGGARVRRRELAGVLAAEPVKAAACTLCAYRSGDKVSWLALDDAGEPVTDRERGARGCLSSPCPSSPRRARAGASWTSSARGSSPCG